MMTLGQYIRLFSHKLQLKKQEIKKAKKKGKREIKRE